MEKRNKEVLIADTISAVTWTEPSVPSVGKSAEMSSCNCQCSVTGLLRPMLRQWGQGQWYKLRQAQGSMDQSHEAQRCCLGQMRQEPSSLANAMEDSQAESMEFFECHQWHWNCTNQSQTEWINSLPRKKGLVSFSSKLLLGDAPARGRVSNVLANRWFP